MKKKIKVTKKGPYIVSGAIPLIKESAVTGSEGYPVKWKKTGTYPKKDTYSLCRCGKSKDMPYCDASHVKTKFNGKETAAIFRYQDAAVLYSGHSVDLMDADYYCMGEGFCDPQGSTWELIKNKNKTSSNTAIKQACNCPSGRLIAVDKKTNKQIEPDFDAHISVTEENGKDINGPLWVKGGIEIESENGNKYEVRNRVTLCRCGKSKKKPFCDGSHFK